jgi:hypothetical protein
MELSDTDGPIVSLRDLSARIALPPDRLTAHIRCASEFWEGVAIETSVRTEGLRAETRIEAAEVRVREFAERLSSGSVPWLGETVLSLRGRIDSEGLRSVKAEIAGAVPTLTVRRASRSRIVRVRALKGTLELDDKGIRATLSDLALDEPRLRVSGDLAVDRASPRIEVKLTGQEGMEIAPVRDALLARAGDVPTVRDILDVVRGGRISRFSFRTGGRSPGELGDLDALGFQATLSGGSIHIPGPDLPLEEVGAEVTMEKGTLAGIGISARMGNARATGGSVRIGFAEDERPFHAEFRAEADVAELPPLLRRLVRDGAFREELDRIREVRGEASGQVVLGERLSSVGVRFTASNVRLAAEYDRIPFPVSVDAGQVSYDGASVAVTDLGGKAGNSSFSGVTGKVVLPDSTLRILSGRVHLDLGELYPWIASFDSVRRAAPDVRSLRGTVEAESLSMGGPLRGAGEWAFDVAGAISGLELDTPLLPGPLSVPGGRFRVRPETASFSGVEASLLDSTVQGSLELIGYRQGTDRFTASFEGGVGPEAAKWAFERIGVPDLLRVKPPFTVTGSEISREKPGAFRAKVDLRHPAGPTLSLSVLAAPGKTTIDPLVIRGPDSDAKMAVDLDPETLRVKFAGTLARVTLEKILPIPPLPGQRIRGELDGVILRGKPSQSSVHGTLEAAGVKIPWEPLAPLVIRDISLAADGRTVRVLSSALAWDNVPFSLTGTAEFGGEEVVADLDVSAGYFDGGKLFRSVKAASAKAGGTDGNAAPPGEARPGPSAPKSFPLQGVVRLRADSVSHGRLSWRPVRAHAQVEGRIFRFTVTEADLCGISMQGSVTLGAGDPVVELATSASGEEIDATIRCLTEERVALTGDFSMSARLAGEGTEEAAYRSLRGPVDIEMKDGRIRKMTLLSSVLELLNVTDLLRGQFPDFRKEGFAYKSLVVRGEAKDGKFALREAVLDAPSMKMVASGEVDIASREADLKVLVAPLRTVDAVVRRIPVLGYILGGSLLSVPVTIKGDIRDPKVTTMDPGAVGAGLLGIFERTLKSPVHVISPYLPGKEKTADDGATP